MKWQRTIQKLLRDGSEFLFNIPKGRVARNAWLWVISMWSGIILFWGAIILKVVLK